MPGLTAWLFFASAFTFVVGCAGTTKRHRQSSPEQRVDLVFHILEQAGLNWNQLQQQISFARKTFQAVGVELNVAEIKHYSFEDKPLAYAASELKGDPQTFNLRLDFYQQILQKKHSLPEKLSSFLESIIGKDSKNSRIIHVVTMRSMSLPYYEHSKQKGWEKKSVPTGAFSFATYLYAERMPLHLRGVISLQASGARASTLAHELGHKLINVSHEGLSACPAFSGKTIPGLMGYHEKSEIYGGKKGRWHRERLLKSPFIYQWVDEKKSYNPDYKDFGKYNDPIYGDLKIEPACKS